eukprot:15365997-Ditylum_brightwellii.AAC.1
MRPDALNVNCMDVQFGGKSASRMHSSKIREVDGYLGGYFYPDRTSEQLFVGIDQSFVFTKNNIGPFYLSEEECKNRKYDVNLGSGKSNMKTKQELRKEIINKDPRCNIKGNVEQIRDRARLMGLTLEKIEDKVLEGWIEVQRVTLKFLGEGIKYTWANSKKYLRGVPLEKRRNKAQFLDTAKLANSRDVGAELSKMKISKFSGHARDFIPAYHLLQNKNKNGSSVQRTVATLSKKDIEKTRKKYQSHRGVEKQYIAWCVGVSTQLEKKEDK